MAKRSSYVMYTTKGNEVTYTYKEMYDIVESYLKQLGKYPSPADIDEEIPRFVSRMTKVEKEEEVPAESVETA